MEKLYYSLNCVVAVNVATLSGSHFHAGGQNLALLNNDNNYITVAQKCTRFGPQFNPDSDSLT